MFFDVFPALSLLFLLWLAFGATYQLNGALAGLFYQNKERNTPNARSAFPSIRVFIPAYREDAVIENTVSQVLASDYPNLEVLVIADGLQADTIRRMREKGARVQEVQFEKSTKSKALNAALSANADRPYDVAVVLDADNAPAPDFLWRVAGHMAAGVQALQGRRAAKASRSALALLDAASEEVNNHILCKGARVLGFSARLAGSGMAFDYGVFAAAMSGIDAIGGFDKALEGTLTRQNIVIEYDEKAVVYDEKVSKGSAFATQRSRWIAAQFHYGRVFLPLAIKELLLQGNVDFFHKSLQMALPPRLLAPGILAAGTVLHALLHTQQTGFWAAALLFNVLAFLLALPAWFFHKKYYYVWLELPHVFLAALKALLHMPTARKVFVVTPKTL